MQANRRRDAIRRHGGGRGHAAEARGPRNERRIEAAALGLEGENAPGRPYSGVRRTAHRLDSSMDARLVHEWRQAAVRLRND
jgi:hypothetical protein